MVRPLLFLGVALALGACDTPDPEAPAPPAPPVGPWEGPRTMSFARVPDLNNEVVLDLDLDVDGMSVAVTQPSLNARKIWLNDGTGWRVLPTQIPATCACMEPGGDAIFVGLRGALFALLDRRGDLIFGPARYNVVGEGSEVGNWTTRQCRWIPDLGERVFVTLSSDDRTGGALLYLDVSQIETSARWTRIEPLIQTQTGNPEDHDLAFDALSVSYREGQGVGASAGVSYGVSPVALNQREISGDPFAGRPWIILPPRPETSAYGAPRDQGSYPERGSATLYRELRGGAWRVMVTTPRGYSGVAVLDAPELSGSALALDVGSDGHLWIGGEGGLGLWRSTEPLQ